MGVVAEDALSLFNRGMEMRLCQPDLLFRMAAVTQLVAVQLHGPLRDEAMAKMTGLALVFLDDGMDVLHAHVLVGEVLVAAETIAAGKPLSLGLCPTAECPLPGLLAVRRLQSHAQQDDRAPRQRPERRLSLCRHHFILLRYTATFECA